MIGIIVGAGIGYVSVNTLKTYVEPYMFLTNLSLTVISPENLTSISLNTTVILEASLDVIIPSELSPIESTVRSFLLQDKNIQLLGKEQVEVRWELWGEAQTSYFAHYGECQFTVKFDSEGTYVFKAVFSGTQLLKSAESETITLTVTS